MFKQIKLLTAIIIFFIFVNVNVYGETFVKTSEQALEIALKITGFSEIKKIKNSATASENVSKVTLEDINIPVIGDLYNGKELWKVNFTDIKLNFQGWSTSIINNQKAKTIEAFIDPESGKIVKIEATCIDCDEELEKLYDEPPLEYMKKLVIAGGEKYHYIPDEEPTISFYDALKKAIPSNPIVAKKIIAYHIIHSGGGNVERHVWHIIGRGIPYDKKKIDSERSVIDANTGVLLYCQNYP